MKLRLNKKVAGIAACGIAALTVVTSVGTATADPVGTPTQRALAGVGSDTTYNALNGLSEVVTIGGVKQIASYDPLPASSLISPKSAANCQNLVRPNGSGAGRTALINSLTPGNAIAGCYDFARSSSLTTTAVPAATGGLTYVPFGIDAFTYAVAKDSSIPRDLTLGDVQSIYKCEVPGITPLLPQAGSGTRSYWLGVMGITEGQLTSTYTCVKDTKNSAVVQENDGRVLTKGDEIFPYSIANYVAQSSGAQADLRGSADLGNIDGKSSIDASDSTTLSRSVYNVIPTSKETVAPWSTVFVGSGSLVCTNVSTIKKFGFAPSASCGSVTAKAPTS